MPSGDKPTIKEHYVPQTYLRGFLQDGNLIIRYELCSGEQQTVPIKSVCVEKSLYEFEDEEGFVLRNYLEKCLGLLESQYITYLKKVQEKSSCKNKAHCKMKLQ